MWNSPFSKNNIENTRNYFKEEMNFPFGLPKWNYCEPVSYAKNEFYFVAFISSWTCEGTHLFQGTISRDGKILECSFIYSWKDVEYGQSLINWAYENLIYPLTNKAK